MWMPWGCRSISCSARACGLAKTGSGKASARPMLTTNPPFREVNILASDSISSSLPKRRRCSSITASRDPSSTSETTDPASLSHPSSSNAAMT